MLTYRRGTAQHAMAVEILSSAAHKYEILPHNIVYVNACDLDTFNKIVEIARMLSYSRANIIANGRWS